jgi:hypothetical protein
MTPIVSYLLIHLIAFLICIVLTKRQRAAFAEHFPPLSDAEFVARCTPGINPRVALIVRRIVADCLSVEYERVSPSARLIEDLGAD